MTRSRSLHVAKFGATIMGFSSLPIRAIPFVKAERGDPTAVVIGGGNTTYGELTVGLTITPNIPANPYITKLIIRPEIRYDASLNGTTPFGAAERPPIADTKGDDRRGRDDRGGRGVAKSDLLHCGKQPPKGLIKNWRQLARNRYRPGRLVFGPFPSSPPPLDVLRLADRLHLG